MVDWAPPWSRAARQAWFNTWCCVCLAVSFLVRSRSSSEKGGPPSFPPLLAPTPGWPLRERRETPPRPFLFVCLFCFVLLFFFGGGEGGGGARGKGIFGGGGGEGFWVEWGGWDLGLLG